MTGWSNGNSFGASAGNSTSAGDSTADGRRVPPWKFGVGPAAMSDDRGGLLTASALSSAGQSSPTSQGQGPGSNPGGRANRRPPGYRHDTRVMSPRAAGGD